MDWNHDGKVDEMDAMIFHEVISKDNNSSEVSQTTPASSAQEHTSKHTEMNNKTGGTVPNVEVSEMGGCVGVIVVVLCVSALLTGNGEIIGTLLGVGLIAFIIAQWLES